MLKSPVNIYIRRTLSISGFIAAFHGYTWVKMQYSVFFFCCLFSHDHVVVIVRGLYLYLKKECRTLGELPAEPCLCLLFVYKELAGDAYNVRHGVQIQVKQQSRQRRTVSAELCLLSDVTEVAQRSSSALFGEIDKLCSTAQHHAVTSCS